MCFGKMFKILGVENRVGSGLVLGLFVKSQSSDCQLDFQLCVDLSLAIFRCLQTNHRFTASTDLRVNI